MEELNLEREREREIEFRVDNGRVRLLLRNLDRSRSIGWLRFVSNVGIMEWTSVV